MSPAATGPPAGAAGALLAAPAATTRYPLQPAAGRVSRGDLQILAEDSTGAGVFAYSRTLGEAEAMVSLNPMLLNQMATGAAMAPVFLCPADVAVPLARPSAGRRQ